MVIGAESTGKSTLAAGLAAHFKAPLATEFARVYAERVNRALTHADVEPIATGQREAEDAAIARAHGGFVVLDTDLLSTVVYATFYYGDCPRWVIDAARARRPDLYLMCDPGGVAWTPDAVRASAEDRDRLDARFVDAVRMSGAAVTWLTGPPDVRLRSAITAAIATRDSR